LRARRDELLAESQAKPTDLEKVIELMPFEVAKMRDTLFKLLRGASSASVTQTARAKTILRKMLGEIPLVQELTKTNGLQPKLVAGARYALFLQYSHGYVCGNA
jgi:hypothetical protein